MLECVATGEYALFFDRLALTRKCEQAGGSTLTTRTNVLLVRQNLLTSGNGIVFTYSSQRNTKTSHRQSMMCSRKSPSAKLTKQNNSQGHAVRGGR